eukprot:1158553-Pelagomonas_calceolata.AAC.4
MQDHHNIICCCAHSSSQDALNTFCSSAGPPACAQHVAEPDACPDRAPGGHPARISSSVSAGGYTPEGPIHQAAIVARLVLLAGASPQATQQQRRGRLLSRLLNTRQPQ